MLYEDIRELVAALSCCITRISELNTTDVKKEGKIIPLTEITNYFDETPLGLVTQYTF